MRLQAALLPPPEVQGDLGAAVASVSGGREQLDTVPTRLLHLRLANFGTVSLRDADALRSTLEQELARAPSLRLRFRGGAVLEPIGDDSAWAELDGDVKGLVDVADTIARAVKPLGFLVDRRLPRTRMRVGAINSATTEPYLVRLIERLESYVGPEWTCHDIILLQMLDPVDGAPAEFEVRHHLKLRSSEPS